MSMWLSTAKRMACLLRDHAAEKVKRQVNAAMTEATRENLKLWSPAVKPAAAGIRRTR